MSRICSRCGKEVTLAQGSFCPFCGAPLQKEQPVSAEAEQWLRRAEQKTSLPEREKILLQARAACPDCLPIEWELLFIGHARKERRKIDFSVIKCYLLEMYLMPEDFSEERKQENRTELFEDPQLLRCLSLSEDPEQRMTEYLLRLCREYVDLFLVNDSRINRTLFGFRVDRNLARVISRPGANMLLRIREDEHLTAEQRSQLFHALHQALSERLEGQTALLEEALLK